MVVGMAFAFGIVVTLCGVRGVRGLSLVHLSASIFDLCFLIALLHCRLDSNADRELVFVSL